jgi:broad specificity phosphatase PhoE
VYPLLVTHEMIGRLLLAALLELEPHAALARDLPHGYLYEVLRSNGWSSSTSRVTVDRSRGSA